MQVIGMPADQLASNLRKLALLQTQVDTQLTRVRGPEPGVQGTSASDRRAGCCSIRSLCHMR